MPTELGERFDVYWRGDPQQMLPADVPLWLRFLDLFGNRFDWFYYNVRVGGPDISKIDADPAMARMWYASTAKRIDAIGERRDELLIIEVASSPYLRAVGQCLSYKFLWDEDPKINKPVHVALICPYLDADLERILLHHGVFIIKMPKGEKPSFAPLSPL
jgi:hypothetical protein